MATAVQMYAEHHMSVDADLSGLSRGEFGKAVVGALELGKKHVVLDCSQWKKLDLMVLSALVRCADVFSSRGATLEIVNLPNEIHAAIRELRLHHRLRLAE
jgi:anti-anti-sigma regulatory factor